MIEMSINGNVETYMFRSGSQTKERTCGPKRITVSAIPDRFLGLIGLEEEYILGTRIILLTLDGHVMSYDRNGGWDSAWVYLHG